MRHKRVLKWLLKDVDFDSVFRRVADRRIEEAMRDGKFDNLPGAGTPLDLELMPADENARMTWWALRILKGNDVVPDEIRWRRQVDLLKDELAAATSEPAVRTHLRLINSLVHRINTLGTNAISLPMAPVSLEEELARVRAG